LLEVKGVEFGWVWCGSYSEAGTGNCRRKGRGQRRFEMKKILSENLDKKKKVGKARLR